MKNKTIFLTGANGGLGRAFIEELISLNPKKMYCAARDVKTLDDIKDLDRCIETVELDITDKNSIQNAISKVEDLDILINNAGTNTNQRLFDENFTDIEVNLKGTMNLTKAFFEKLKHSNAKVINISSIVALVNLPVMANYSISKSALHSFTQALRAELGQFECEVYEALPGAIDTRMTEGMPISKEKPRDIVKAILDAVDKKEFEIFPDDYSKMIKEKLGTEPKVVEQEFALSVTPSI